MKLQKLILEAQKIHPYLDFKLYAFDSSVIDETIMEVTLSTYGHMRKSAGSVSIGARGSVDDKKAKELLAKIAEAAEHPDVVKPSADKTAA